jgi:hypothetical protein
MNYITLELSDSDQCKTFAILIKNLNEQHVTYKVFWQPCSSTEVTVEITNGY